MKNYSNLDVILKMLTIITNRRLLAVAMLFFVTAISHAHHSVPVHYDLSTEDSVSGVITRVVWRNPHSFMELDVTNDDGVAQCASDVLHRSCKFHICRFEGGIDARHETAKSACFE